MTRKDLVLDLVLSALVGVIWRLAPMAVGVGVLLFVLIAYGDIWTRRITRAVQGKEIDV